MEPPGLADRGIQRTFQRRAFLYEKVPVQLEVVNRHWLPVPWLQLTEASAAGIDRAEHLSQRHHHSGRTIATGSRITLHADRRGYYTIGPLHLRSGDLIGLTEELDTEGARRSFDRLSQDHSVCRMCSCPRVPRSARCATRSPSSKIPAACAANAITWRAIRCAASIGKRRPRLGRLQVKQFEPSIALETAILLNLNADEYDAAHAPRRDRTGDRDRGVTSQLDHRQAPVRGIERERRGSDRDGGQSRRRCRRAKAARI